MNTRHDNIPSLASAHDPAISLWLATPDAARRFDAAALSTSDAQRWARMGRATRRDEWAASRALRAHLAVPDGATTSLSHSAGHAAMALASGDLAIGVDIEGLRPRAVQALAKYAFSDREHAELVALPPEQQLIRFYLLWTLKEAAAKALGIELLVATRDCVFFLDAGCWRGRLPRSGTWRAWAYAPRPELVFAVLAIGTGTGEATPLQPSRYEWPTEKAGDWTVLLQIGPTTAS